MPTPERCQVLGVKFEGLHNRTLMWLTGVSCGISYVSGAHFAVILSPRSSFTVETDSSTILNNVKDRLEAYGFKTEEV